MLSSAENERLTRVGPGTEMGRLLRKYWHPVAPEGELHDNPLKRLKVLGEDVVLFRLEDEEREYGMVQSRCPHRGADLGLGWVEGETLRCMYHGWSFDRLGQCRSQPFEDVANDDSTFKRNSGVRAYETHAAGGLIWAYLGEGPAPAFPLYEPFTWSAGFTQIVVSELRCNWFHCHENSVDPVHFEWLHYNWTAAQSNEADPVLGPRHVEIEFVDHDFGIECLRTTEGSANDSTRFIRSKPQQGGVVSVWPNGLFTGDHFEWRVPIDDERTLNFLWWYSPRPTDIDSEPPFPTPYWYGPVDDPSTGDRIISHPMNQDFAAWESQGVIPDRSTERLGRSDAGITRLRRRFIKEMNAADTEAPIRFDGRPDDNGVIRMPIANRERLETGIERAEFERIMAVTKKRLGEDQYFGFQAGQPDCVKRQYEKYMGIDSQVSER